jgi:hypothetical protein
MPRTISIALALALAFVAAPSFADPKPDAKQLAADRVAAAKKVFDAVAIEKKAGVSSSFEIPVWSVRLLDAQLDDPASAKPRALQDHLDRMTAFRNEMEAGSKAMTVSVIELYKAEYFVAEAKLWVARGKK